MPQAGPGGLWHHAATLRRWRVLWVCSLVGLQHSFSLPEEEGKQATGRPVAWEASLREKSVLGRNQALLYRRRKRDVWHHHSGSP